MHARDEQENGLPDTWQRHMATGTEEWARPHSYRLAPGTSPALPETLLL